MERATRTAIYRYLIVLTIASTVGLQSWRTLFNNFAVDVALLNGQQVGIIQSLRELPGFLTLLVVKFNYSVGNITMLFVLNNIINYFVTPWLGKGIIRYGERKVLSLEYSSLIAIFVTYAFTGSRVVVAFLYVFDQILFNFSIAIRTYFQKVGDPKDIAPSMAVGFTINHIAAVVLPALGGAIWLIDDRWVFFGGAP